MLLFAFGVFLIFFLSWKANPNLKETPFIPEWLSNWADYSHNNQRRTGVPFMGLGLLAGIYFIYSKRTAPVNWIFAWLILGIVVCMAEVGQYFIPARSLDMKDVFWGGLGAGIGLLFPYFAWLLIRMLK